MLLAEPPAGPAPAPWSFEPGSYFGRPIVTSPETGLVAILADPADGPAVARCPEMLGLLRRAIALRSVEEFAAVVAEALLLVDAVDRERAEAASFRLFQGLEAQA